MLAWLDQTTPLPPPRTALPDGLLAMGGDLSAARLTEAYSKGIFPWYNEGDPVLWWSPDPRMVLACDDFSPSHSLRKKLRQVARNEFDDNAPVQITMNMVFDLVIEACASTRISQGSGTWISPAMQSAYRDWHRQGRVHSIETWIEGRLVGGLYGVSLGRFFFGESMFSTATDASKLALAYLVNFLARNGVKHIDCQQQTRHLASMGARPIPREAFLSMVEEALRQPPPPWGRGRLLQSGLLAPA